MVDRKKNWSRRDILKTAGIAGVGTMLGTVADKPLLWAGEIDKGEGMPTRPFGRTGIDVPILSLGGMFDIPNNQLLLHQAIRKGVTYWDTANVYLKGKSELGIGMYFKKYPEAREKIFLVTKSGARDPKGLSDHLATSLQRMNTDYIDLFFIHSISHIKEMSRDIRVWAEKMKAGGKIKFIGFSTHKNMEKCLKKGAKLGWIDGIMMSYNFRLMHKRRMKKAVDACVEAGIGLTAMKTQGGGPVKAKTEKDLRLAGKFMKRGFTDKQARLMAVWENPQISAVCSQMPNMKILQSNIDAARNRERYSGRDRELLNRYAVETESLYCGGCAHICESAIDCDVPVSDILRYLMYMREYGDRGRAVESFAKIPVAVKKLIADADYSVAETRCPRNIPIARLMREAVEELA